MNISTIDFIQRLKFIGGLIYRLVQILYHEKKFKIRITENKN